MALIDWKAPIEAVHGKLYKGFGAAKRSLANKNGEMKNYSVFYGKRSTTPSSDEIANRAKFKAISLLVAARRTDISKRTSDQAAFKAQSTYKTLTSYLWSVCTAQYNSTQNA